MKKLLLLVLFFLVNYGLHAQAFTDEEQRVIILSRNYGDSVVIRWAPSTPALWMACNKSGYKIERVFKYSDGVDEDEFPIIKERYEPVRSEVFKPLPLEEMIKRYEDGTHPMGMVATEFLYGDVDLQGEDHGFLSKITAESESQNMRFAYTLFAADLDPDVADALGLRYSFKTAGITDSTIYFRLISLVDTTKFNSDTLYITIDVFDIDQKPFPPYDLYTEGGDGHIKLSWVKDRKYTAYYIERSTDSINFTLLNEEPFLSSSAEGEEIKDQFLPDTNFIDTNSLDTMDIARNNPMPMHEYNVYLDSVSNGIKYYYRVYGIDAFGDKSDYSEIVSGQGEDEHPLLPPFEVAAVALPDGRVKISWKEPKDKTKLQGYLVVHAHEFGQEQYNLLSEDLLPVGTTEFYHNNVKAGTFNIYIVSCIDDKGKYVKSSPATVSISDTIPPNPPIGVKAIIDTNGLCLITWDASEEDDVVGYKVYSSYDPEGTFDQITEYKVETNALLDRVNLEFLNRYIYYRVVAVDRIGLHSEFSEMCKALIPDIHPPITPLVKSFLVRDNGVNIKFIVGNDADAKEYRIMRKEANTEFSVYKSIPIDDVKDNVIEYDETIENEAYYEYALQVEDQSGLISELSQVVPVTIAKNEGDDVLLKIESKYSEGDNTVTLKWKSPNNIKREVFNYVLFKREQNGLWEMYNSFDKNTNEYIDTKIEKGKHYEYKLIPYADGASIGMGEIHTIQIK